jgi:hypothetical protein
VLRGRRLDLGQVLFISLRAARGLFLGIELHLIGGRKRKCDAYVEPINLEPQHV